MSKNVHLPNSTDLPAMAITMPAAYLPELPGKQSEVHKSHQAPVQRSRGWSIFFYRAVAVVVTYHCKQSVHQCPCPWMVASSAFLCKECPEYPRGDMLQVVRQQDRLSGNTLWPNRRLSSRAKSGAGDEQPWQMTVMGCTPETQNL